MNIVSSSLVNTKHLLLFHCLFAHGGVLIRLVVFDFPFANLFSFTSKLQVVLEDF